MQIHILTRWPSSLTNQGITGLKYNLFQKRHEYLNKIYWDRLFQSHDHQSGGVLRKVKGSPKWFSSFAIRAQPLCYSCSVLFSLAQSGGHHQHFYLLNNAAGFAKIYQPLTPHGMFWCFKETPTSELAEMDSDGVSTTVTPEEMEGTAYKANACKSPKETIYPPRKPVDWLRHVRSHSPLPSPSTVSSGNARLISAGLLFGLSHSR